MLYENKSFIKHTAAALLSSMIIWLNTPYNLGYASLEGSTWITITVLSLACFALIEAVFFWKVIDRVFNISFRRALLALNFILIILISIHFIWQIRYYRYMWLMGSELATFQQMFWNTVNGGGFFYNSLEGTCRFFIHLAPLVLIALPFYALYQHVYTLFFIQSVFFCYACLPLFLIASKRLNNITSIVISIGFLFYPFIVGPTFSSFRETALIAFFMFFTFYLFEEKRFHLYLLFLLLTMMARETVPLTCFMFAIYAFIKKRPARWIMATAILTISYFLIFLLMQKAVGYIAFETYPSRFVEAYGFTGSGSILPAIISKLSNPKAVIASIFDIEKAKYVYRLLSPCVLILPLSSIEIIFIIPLLCAFLPADNMQWLSPMWHYSMDISIFIWISTIFTISKLTNNKKIATSLNISKERLSLIMAIFVSIMALSTYHTWHIKHERMSNSYYETVKEVTSFIPPDASVCAASCLMPFLCEGRHAVALYKFEQTDYIVIDINRRHTNIFVPKAEEKLKNELAMKYEVVFRKEGIIVYAKKQRHTDRR